MTLLELRTELLRMAGEDPAAPVFHTTAAANAAINAAQQVFAGLTLCLESTATITSSGWTATAALLPKLIVPLRVRYGARRLHPATVDDLAALSANWSAHIDSPTQYLWLGWDLFRPYPLPGSVSYEITYATAPAVLAADSDVPQIPEDDHHELLEYAMVRIRLAEGGAELAKDTPRLERFMAAVESRAARTRARYIALGYDTRPAEKFLQEATQRWRSTAPAS